VLLIYLHLEGNALSGTISSSVGDLTQLSDLWLGSNKLVGFLPFSLGYLLALQVLSLSRNCLIGAIPSSISNLRSLRVLWLNSNKLTGTIPSSLSLLSSLYTAYLFANSLTGTIPSSLGALHKLMALSAYRNYLHGQIPRSFENLHALTSFRIYDNYLTGSLPSELCGHSLVDFYPKRLKEGTADLRIFTDNLLTCYAPCLSSVAFHYYGGIPPCNLSEARRYDAISSVNPSARPTYYPTQPTAARGSDSDRYPNYILFVILDVAIISMLVLECSLPHCSLSLPTAPYHFRQPPITLHGSLLMPTVSYHSLPLPITFHCSL